MRPDSSSSAEHAGRIRCSEWIRWAGRRALSAVGRLRTEARARYETGLAGTRDPSRPPGAENDSGLESRIFFSEKISPRTVFLRNWFQKRWFGPSTFALVFASKWSDDS